MKEFGKIAQELIPKPSPPCLIYQVRNAFGFKTLDTPIMSSEVRCPLCGGNLGYSPLIDPKISDKHLWFCALPECNKIFHKSDMSSLKNKPEEIKKRAIEWNFFCTSSNLGDTSFGITFDQIEQSEGKISYLRKFAQSPQGIIVMRGKPGRGKTFSALALCELFTRNSNSCVFITQKQMQDDWVDSFKNNNAYDNKNRLTNISLLVIDDFGVCKPPDGFLGYFMEIINSRLQWSTRGTVITTTLSQDSISSFCGDALADRINMGQFFEFEGKSRRRPIAL